MDNKVKSGKEILDEFFNGVSKLENVDENIAGMLAKLYQDNKLTDTNLKNALQEIRDRNDD